MAEDHNRRQQNHDALIVWMLTDTEAQGNLEMQIALRVCERVRSEERIVVTVCRYVRS